MKHLILVAVASLVTGCGLIDSDILDVSFSLPSKEVTMDTAQWEMQVSGEFPDIPCAGTPGVCTAAGMELCTGVQCFPSCDGTSCEVLVQVALWRTFDLANESPALADINDAALVDVTIDRIFYEVTENTLNVDSPELTIYVAPQTTMNPGDPSAKAFGVVAPIARGATGEGNVTFTGDGRSQLRSFMADFRTPFNVIVGAVVELQPGDPIPEGRLKVVVHAEATAGL